MLLLPPPNITLRRLPIVTCLVEYCKEVRRSEIFVSDVTVLVVPTTIVVNVPLTLGNVVPVLPARVM